MPEELKPADLWTQITQLPRPFRIVDFPRKDPKTGLAVGEIAMVVLMHEEQIACSSRAEELTRKLLKEKNISAKSDEARRGYDDIYNNVAAVEILFRACKKKEDITSSFFPAPEMIRAKLSDDEVGVLMNEYFTVKSEIGPIISHLSDEEYESWIRRLKEGGSAFPLDFLSREALQDLTYSLACRLYTFMTATSSPGSLPDSPIENEKLSNPTSDPTPSGEPSTEA